ncbi:hypothetical protein TraAM80_06190 [Trypanosoma rangeli]|uniref:SKP1 component POZ domain-containing protein n=1 Tax=Trypanosoma rangeli TaxID=5698 RepID=A0A3R7K7C7_TRYRA|nr:uncharacterized protein TraAM80_06190 [Trypanosoma rangeli]RNF02956.1 hypothetical protein TraAM80_06190 [Trypanosoma rangeli]|eukprot:RNF02956.1 hypothetical protein TraAM80_06190 [Trypanosoma rangeli]
MNDFTARLELLSVTGLVEGNQQTQLPLHVNVRLGDGALFRCPSAMLREGSVTLSELLEGVKEEEMASRQVELPLPSVDSAVFETVALYLEHFYEPTNSTSSEGSNAGVNNIQVVAPNTLSRPLHVQELYRLSEWEHCFVVQRLLMWPQNLWELSKEGQWVDMAAAAVGSSQSVGQCDVQHLLRVLEAATMLEIPLLRDLCAAVLANLLMDVDEKGIMELMGVTETLGPDEERTLLNEYPWLKL